MAAARWRGYVLGALIMTVLLNGMNLMSVEIEKRYIARGACARAGGLDGREAGEEVKGRSQKLKSKEWDKRGIQRRRFDGKRSANLTSGLAGRVLALHLPLASRIHSIRTMPPIDFATPPSRILIISLSRRGRCGACAADPEPGPHQVADGRISHGSSRRSVPAFLKGTLNSTKSSCSTESGWAPRGRAAIHAANCSISVRQLRDGKFDLVIDLQGLFRSGWMAWQTGRRCASVSRSARELAPLFYTHRVDVGSPEQHAIERYPTIAETLGCGRGPVRHVFSNG